MYDRRTFIRRLSAALLAGAMVDADATPSLIAIPPGAASVGYNMRTFGSALTLNNNWFNFNFLGVTPNAGQSVQNADGSVGLGAVADGSGYAAGICTAKQINGTGWTGNAFGGGAYFEATLSFTPTPGVNYNPPFPSFWSEDINWLAVPTSAQWPGQATGYIHRSELDFMQWPHNPTQSLKFWESAINIDWYGISSASQVSQPANSETLMPPALFNNPQKYGCLWVPATASTQGYIKSYLNDVYLAYASGDPLVTWNQYNSANSPPPVAGSTAGSILDVDHMAMILGTDTTCPMTVYSASVWQASAANNLSQ